MSTSREKLSIAGAFILLSVPIYLLTLWFYACGQETDHAAIQGLYRSYLPEFLKARHAPSLYSLPLCALAIILGARNVGSPSKHIRILSRVVVILGALLLFAMLWSMM